LENKVTTVVNDIDRRLKALEERVGTIPDPFVLYYKAPGESEHKKINESLDNLYARLNILEAMTFD
jgi:hypothetical protein